MICTGIASASPSGPMNGQHCSNMSLPSPSGRILDARDPDNSRDHWDRVGTGTSGFYPCSCEDRVEANGHRTAVESEYGANGRDESRYNRDSDTRRARKRKSSGVISRFPAAVYDAGEYYGIRRDQSPALQLVRHACGRGRESANFTDESKRVGVFGSGDAWRPHQMVRQFDVHINQRMRMRSERGFSLIEAMIALAILSFGLLAVAG